MEIIEKYFPELDKKQISQFEMLLPLYADWNSKINVISRKDLDNFYTNHVLHSLAIAKITDFKSGTKILDLGTGGGFPGIPLAIMFPECRFTLVDSIGKKIMVVNEVIKSLQLYNIEAYQKRAETIDEKFDFIVSRAVTSLPEFASWVEGKVSNDCKNKLRNGILYLKGGEFTDELSRIKFNHRIFDLKKIFDEEFFETKKIVHLF
jgi:16S rRNA (guanine527-N7)-methyltransferase